MKKIDTYVFIRVRHACGCLAHSYFLKDYPIKGKKKYKYSDMVLTGIKKDLELGHTFNEYRHLFEHESHAILEDTDIPAEKSKVVKEVTEQAETYKPKVKAPF